MHQKIFKPVSQRGIVSLQQHVDQKLNSFASELVDSSIVFLDGFVDCDLRRINNQAESALSAVMNTIPPMIIPAVAAGLRL